MAFVVAFLLAVCASSAQVLLKFGVARQLARQGSVSNIAELAMLVTDNAVIGGLTIYGICAIAWLWVLTKLQVSYAYPILALTFVFVPLIGKLTLGERVAPSYWAGAFLIFCGVAVLLSNFRVGDS
jgi:drug/metabolite transporter (DMT)-like permease